MARSRLRLTIYMGAAKPAVGGGAIAAVTATTPTTRAAGTPTALQAEYQAVVTNGTFSQSDARALVTFANANKIGFVSFWAANRDRNACTGALFQCTNVPQTAFEFSKILAGFRG
jgi:hypothetical protein